MSKSESRYERVTRRAFLRNTVLAGAATALVPTLAACAESDEKVLAGKDTPTVPPTTSPTTPAATRPSVTPTPTTRPSSTPTPTTRPATATTAPTSATVPAGDPVPTGAQLTVDFTFAAAATGGRVNNPFIAVWIENAAGTLVDTVSLWYNPPKGSRWLPDLRRWYSTSRGGGSGVAAVTSATRVPGSYSVVWDATDAAGALVAQGTYFVCIEAAREHGPYELIRQQIALGAKAFTTTLTPNGELTAAAVKFNV